MRQEGVATLDPSRHRIVLIGVAGTHKDQTETITDHSRLTPSGPLSRSQLGNDLVNDNNVGFLRDGLKALAHVVIALKAPQ